MCIIWFLWLGSAVLYSCVSASAALDSLCPDKRPFNASVVGNVRQLYIGSTLNFTMEKNEQLRCSLQLKESIPLVIKVTSPQNSISRRLFFNETINMTKHMRMQKENVVLPCATNGQYDLILTSKKHSFVRVEVLGRHPSWNWRLLNETNPIRVRSQNRMQKKQMIIKWSKSKLDIHAMHYCIVINTKASQKNFCAALQDSLNSNTLQSKRNCLAPIDNIWVRQRERIIDPYSTNVICTGMKPNQIIKGLVPNMKYFIDIYGVHSKKQNLTILLKSTSVWFNRTHPGTLRDNLLTLGKMSGSKRDREAIFSYKIPPTSLSRGQVRFLVLPCSGSQIDVKILKRRQRIRTETDIYKPTYIPVPEANPGDRLILRVKPSNVDEFLHANRVGIAVSMTGLFKHYPELPSNTSVFLSGSYRNCDPKIAWYPSQDLRKIRYCVIIFRLPNNSRSSMDETNYCLDFGKNLIEHPQFYEQTCHTANRGAQMEQTSLLNLIPGDSYLVYVTSHLVGHSYLPYESLKVNIHQHCRNNTDDVSVRAI
ncbi:unnamed protein product [Hermetia illucens]|uniref:Neuron-derived neurotrophic factor first Fn(III) domain-containing protein n=1 Tax=Hermetia illucens TaxID=343691 RepID=A0A7R8UXS9_HERIL|nr:uncharacterized protein LOC119656185 isoform X2 [Hermetia illucens]CAD7088521.1 unnamed protein product [Hermetia illucens]